LEEDDILDFLEEQIPKHNLTAKAFSNLKGITRGFMKRAKKRRLIDFSVEEMLDELDVSDHDFKRTVKEDYEEVFSEDEMPVIIDYLVNHLDPWNIGILLMFVTGIRVGELVALKHDVFDGNSFKVRRTETKYKENGKYVYEVKEFPKSAAGVRTVVIPSDYAWLCGKIKALNPFGEYVFVGKDGQRMTTNCIRMRLRRLCEKVKVYHKSPHKVRKTYGSILLDNNIDQRLIIGQMGHTDVYCTETHYHRNRRNIDRKTEIISAIPEFSLALGK
jgi:integrase